MVQCQRTRRRLRLAQPDGRTFICAYCPAHETYVHISEPHRAATYVDAAATVARSEFGVPDDGVPTVVWLGDGPETVFEEELDRWHVYLGRSGNANQHAYQAAHEAFHRVCTPPNTIHWAHEVLAVLFSLVFLEHVGMHGYAALTRTSLHVAANDCTLPRLLATRATPYPDGVYGRALIVGHELLAAVGWPALKSLATARDASGHVSAEGWLCSLTPEQEFEARVVLTPDSSPT